LERLGEIKPFWLEPPYELVSKLRPAKESEPVKVARCRSNDIIELLNMPRKHE